ncbi:MAG: citramalate synthase, partial [Pikeienuella sp.]
MTGERIWLFDTTLRDGGQTRGVDFSVADKQAIARALDEFGLDYVEAGWPGANPIDDGFFSQPPEMKNARLVAFGMTRRGGRSADNDPGFRAILDAGTPSTCLVG